MLTKCFASTRSDDDDNDEYIGCAMLIRALHI